MTREVLADRNAPRSTIDGMPPLWRTSDRSSRRPRTRLLPPVSNARLSAAGLVGRKLVGATALVRIVVAKGACWRPPRVVDRAPHSSTTLPTQPGGGQVGLLDAVKERVGPPRRVGEAPVALDRRDCGAAHGNLGQFAAQLRGRTGNDPALAERPGQRAPRLHTMGQIDILPAGDRLLGLGIQNGYGADHHVLPHNS